MHTDTDTPPQPMTVRLSRNARTALDEIARDRGLRFVAVTIEVLALEERARLRGGAHPADHPAPYAEAEGPDADVPTAALRASLAWWIARRHQGVRVGWDDARVHAGCRIAWLPRALREALGSSGHAPDAVIRAWADRGWLVVHEGRLTARVSPLVDPSRPRAYIWSPAAMAVLARLGVGVRP